MREQFLEIIRERILDLEVEIDRLRISIPKLERDGFHELAKTAKIKIPWAEHWLKFNENLESILSFERRK